MNFRTFLAALAVAVVAAPVHAQSFSTLQKIADAKTVVLGYRVDAVPFSFRDDKGQPAGYSVDLCRQVVGAIERAVGVPNLEVRWVPVTAESRISQVLTGAIDLECGVTTVTLGRMEQVDFSSMIFVEGGSLLVRADGGAQRLADLAGKTIGVLPGTTTEARLRATLAARRIDARLVSVADERAGASAVTERRIDAFAGDRIVLLGVGLRTGGGAVLALLQEDFSIEPYALMMRRDPAFRLVVNRALAQLYGGPGIGEIYDRWFAKLGNPGSLLVSMYYLNAFTE